MMNFWPRDRFPFIPAMTAPIFQPVAPHFNNPAWEIAQPIVANPAYFPSGLDPNSPWAQASNQVDSKDSSDSLDKEEKSASPWLPNKTEQERRETKETGSSSSPIRDRGDRRDRGRDRDERDRDRARDRDRSRRHRSREPRSNDRSDDGSRSSREDDKYRDKRGRNDDDDMRKRSPRERRRRSSDDEESDRRRKDRKRDDSNERNDDPKKSKGDGDGKYSLEAANYKYQTPNETIMIRGLAQHISENDLRQDIVQCGLMPKDIRLIRKKETGVSRGFAFVEFNSTEEALCWMELKQGVLMLQDMYRAVMQFSIANDSAPGPNWQPSTDWDCPKCFAHNFKKRMTCYKCLALRPDPSNSLDPNFEISPHPTTKLVIRNLDALTTEEELLKEISAVSSISIQSCQISRDSLTNLSRCVCYLEMKNVLEAIKLFNELTARPLVIQSRKVAINYCKLQPEKGLLALQAHPTPWPSDQQYTLADVPQLAEYSARMYASNPAQKAVYIQYYTQYYTNHLNQISIPEGTDTNAAAAVAQSAIQMAQTKKAALAGTAVSAATALNSIQSRPATTYLSSQQLIGNASIGEPDVSCYVYDESSGYYFDHKTGLYYDANTQYYYHGQDQVYLYWDAEKHSFQRAPSDNRQEKPEDGKDEKKKEKEKQQDKVKVAKRIAKDMERWAKTLNQKKEVARMNAVAVQQAQTAARSAATADIAYAVLERKEAGVLSELSSPCLDQDDKSTLVASYGGGSDSDEGPDDSSITADETTHTDWTKMACLLCKRQFPTKDALQRHQQLSDLHKQNLEAWNSMRGSDFTKGAGGSGYRDRAKERRQKFGIPDTPKPSRLKEKYMKEQEDMASIPFEEPARSIPSGNVGSKMLQKMGWSEGMGLGKMNQGRTEIVEAMHRVSSAGLGAAGSSLGPATGSSASYKDHVKRVAMARFSELKD